MNFLSELGIEEANAGTCLGPARWLEDGESWLTSINPSDGNVIGRVRATSADEYERLMQTAVEASQAGDTGAGAVRPCASRRGSSSSRDALGSLPLEMGKIKQEGDGEVQEMIDIADFAVGQSRKPM